MGAVKSMIHDALEARAFIEDEMPWAAKRFETVAKAIEPHLCASDRAKDEHWTIAAAVIHALDEMEAPLEDRVTRLEQNVFPGDFAA